MSISAMYLMNSRTTLNIHLRYGQGVGWGITILLMDDKRKTSGISDSFTLKSGFNFSSSSSKIQTLLDVLARMALLGALHKKIQLQKRCVLRLPGACHPHLTKVRPVSAKGLPVSLAVSHYPL